MCWPGIGEGHVPADDILSIRTRHGQCQEDRDAVSDTPRRRLRCLAKREFVPVFLGSGIGLSVG